MFAWRCGGLGLATVALLNVAPLAGCGDDGGSPVPVASKAAMPPASVLARDLALFRRPRTAADAVPESLLPDDGAKALGLSLDTSRRAREYEGQAIYVVASSKLTCTYSRQNEVGNCWPTTTVTRSLASASSLCGLGTDPGEIVTYGILPDGVREVTVLRDKEPDRAVPVIGNVYVAATSSRPPLPLRIAFVKDGRRVTRPTGIPRDLARDGCPKGSRPPAGVP